MERHVSYLSGENCQVHFSNFRDQSKSKRKKNFYGELMSAIYQEKEITNYSNFPTKCMILCKRSKICMQGNICMESCACQLFIRRRRGHTAVCRIMKKNGWDASGGGATSYFSAIVLQTNTHTNPNPNTNTNTNTNLHIFGNCFTNKQKLRKTKGIVSTSKGQREWIWKVALWISYIKW